MPVGVVSGSGRVRVVSLAPVESNGEWVGAAGGTSNLDQAEAATLAVLSRSQVLILDADGNVVGSSVPEEEAAELATAVNAAGITGAPVPEAAPAIREITVGQTPYLVTRTQITDASSVVFLKNLENELAVLPRLRRIALLSAAFTLTLALVLGSLFGARLARPVGSLANAADRLSSGDFEAPLEPSGISEVTRVSVAFDEMRKALKARLAELEHVNKELEDRQERLMVLQAELVQRDRLASAGRLLSQLAHEIRNPIAGIRNCLEVVRRRAEDDVEAQRFADMAIDELLRMHELTEQMLDVHRPRDPKGSACAVNEIAREVATLLRAGTDPGKQLSVSVVSRDGATARVAPDSLKQVLLNLGLNACEAMHDEGPIEIVISSGDGQVTIEVLDRGPGIDEDIISRIFDPFFTTKEQVHGVGLGLFTAEAIVRTYGGRIAASNRTDGPGARFTVQLPEAEVRTSETDTDGQSG
jgi:signal transduction histidine kinase